MLRLSYEGELRELWLEGHNLMEAPQEEQNIEGKRWPYVQRTEEGVVYVRLTDWVGKLNFEMEDDRGRSALSVMVFPRKLASDPERSFQALRAMSEEVAAFASNSKLDFPQELAAEFAQSQSPKLSEQVLDQLIAAAWKLWQEAKREPRMHRREQRVIDRSGSVPDRVDWEGTVELWAHGEFPSHVSRKLTPSGPPPCTEIMRRCWKMLLEASETGENTPEQTHRVRQCRAALADLPPTPPTMRSKRTPQNNSPLMQRARHLEELIAEMPQQGHGLPQGHTSMSALYETWSMTRILQALGATNGKFVQKDGDFYQGTFKEPNSKTTVYLGIKQRFGMSDKSYTLREPDILVVQGRHAFVAEVKYRPLDRLNSEEVSKINSQIVTYMGMNHARVGLVLWPGQDEQDGNAERLKSGQMPHGRAFLGSLSLHPFDSLETLQRDLRRAMPELNVGIKP